jgi:hypothetical protein
MENNYHIQDSDIEELQALVLSMKMEELFSEPYDPPEYLEDS